MPRYDYLCLSCVLGATDRIGRELTDAEVSEFVFETMHGMDPTDCELEKATQCPECGGNDVRKIVSSVNTFVRGHDWEEFKRKNKAAMQRDMALHQLENNDPYAHMRPDGDKNDLADKLKAGRIKKPEPKYFTGASKRS